MSKGLWLCMFFCVASLVATPAPADVADALPAGAPWRVHLVCAQQDRQRKTPVQYTPAPADAWTDADFDDSGWGRYGADLYQTLGGYGFDQAGNTAMLALRTRFGIAEPAAAGDLTLALEYRGGVVVFVNGIEVARQHLPAGPLTPESTAENYPPEAFVDPAGVALPRADRPAEEHRDRYEKRIRRLTVALPTSSLRRGSNTLAIALYGTSAKVPIGSRNEWSTAGLCSVSLTSKSGSGVIAYADALNQITISNATPMDTIAVNPRNRQAGFLWWGITITPVALTRGNPFEPLRPIRMVAPRGGTCSGQVVVSGPAAISGLKASISPLRHTREIATLPAQAVHVRYATQEKDEFFCNALRPSPADGAAVQPVWVLADVPRDQPPGWYSGTLTISVAGRTTAVPVQLLVAGWTLTDPRDNATLVSMYQSPDTLADHFKLQPWSDKHFAMIEKSMRTMAAVGNDVLLVPVVIDNYLGHKHGLVRWVRKANSYEPEFSAFEKYLDLQTKIWGKPKVVTLSVWKHDFGTRTWFRGMKSDVIKPCMVTELDPRTGAMSPMQAPHFGEPGSEAFWKAMTDGVRRILKQRGIDDRFLLLGEAFDSRPLEQHRAFFAKIEPTMRWQIYSHFDGGEPAPKDGKFISHGGFEVGFRISPGSGGLPEFAEEKRKPDPNREYLVAGVHRCEIHLTSSPLSYRAVMRTGGSIARIGLDFWPIGTDSRGRARSYYGSPPNEGWLWRGHVPYLTAAGEDGAILTTRGQMLLESLQESELLIALVRAKAKASPVMIKRIDACMAARHKAMAVGKALSQATISLDWLGMSADEYALAAQIASEAHEGDWRTPPAVATGGRP
mgnify:CR=1 FL=1